MIKPITREDMIATIKDYLDLINTKSEQSTQDMAEYIVGGCFETFLERDDFWKTEDDYKPSKCLLSNRMMRSE